MWWDSKYFVKQAIGCGVILVIVGLIIGFVIGGLI